MQLARPALALALGGGQALPMTLGANRLSRSDGHRRADSECFEQPLVVWRERRSPFQAVERDQGPIGRAPEDERNDETALCIDAQPPQTVLVEAGTVELFLQVLRTQRAHRLSGFAVGQGEVGPDNIVGQLTCTGRYYKRLAMLELDQQRARGYQRAPPLRHQLEDHIEVGLAPHRPRDLRCGLERGDGPLQLLATLPRSGIAPRMVDGDAGELRKHLDGHLV